MGNQFFTPSGDNRDKLHQERDRLIADIDHLEEEQQSLLRENSQMNEYVSALESKLRYRRTIKILADKKDSWPWAEARIRRNEKLSDLIDPVKKKKVKKKKGK